MATDGQLVVMWFCISRSILYATEILLALYLLCKQPILPPSDLSVMVNETIYAGDGPGS
jgi:hypothetical protein